MVSAPRGERLAIWTERHRPHRFRVSLEGSFLLARRHLPQLDRFILAARSQCLAVRTVRQGVQRTRVSLQGGLLLARLNVPQLDGLVCAPRGERLAVRAKSHGGYHVRVSVEGVAAVQAPGRTVAPSASTRGRPLPTTPSAAFVSRLSSSLPPPIWFKAPRTAREVPWSLLLLIEQVLRFQVNVREGEVGTEDITPADKRITVAWRGGCTAGLPWPAPLSQAALASSVRWHSPVRGGGAPVGVGKLADPPGSNTAARFSPGLRGAGGSASSAKKWQTPPGRSRTGRRGRVPPPLLALRTRVSFLLAGVIVP